MLFNFQQVTTVDWPFEDSDKKPPKNDLGQKPRQSIMDFLSGKAFGLAINLPMRSGGCSGSGSSARHASMSSITTRGYKFRRLAIQLSLPLITDVKCAKLFVQVLSCCWTNLGLVFKTCQIHFVGFVCFVTNWKTLSKVIQNYRHLESWNANHLFCNHILTALLLKHL